MSLKALLVFFLGLTVSTSSMSSLNPVDGNLNFRGAQWKTEILAILGHSMVTLNFVKFQKAYLILHVFFTCWYWNSIFLTGTHHERLFLEILQVRLFILLLVNCASSKSVMWSLHGGCIEINFRASLNFIKFTVQSILTTNIIKYNLFDV
jgi:hypothetical protein